MEIKTYSKLSSYKHFEDRLNYLMCNNMVGEETFGSYRYLNQRLYSSNEWKRVRGEIIIRDNGFDLAHKDFPIFGMIYVHHLNPITIDDILEGNFCVFDPENLVSTSFDTHNTIHYGKDCHTLNEPITRSPNDTCPWRNNNG